MISELAPPNHAKVFFTNGGADANENAVRMARLHTGRHKVLAAYRSYHGNTATAVTLTGDPRRWPNENGIAGIVHFFGPYPYRSPFWATSDEQEADRALQHLEAVIEFEGPHTIAALVLETVERLRSGPGESKCGPLGHRDIHGISHARGVGGRWVTSWPAERRAFCGLG